MATETVAAKSPAQLLDESMDQLNRAGDALRRARGPWKFLYMTAMQTVRGDETLFGFEDPNIPLGTMEAIDDALDALDRALYGEEPSSTNTKAEADHGR